MPGHGNKTRTTSRRSASRPLPSSKWSVAHPRTVYYLGSRPLTRTGTPQVMHARSGGQYEIMGLMQGKLEGDTFVVMDAFALPVVGTETRVNAANEANEFMIQYIESSPAVRRSARLSRKSLLLTLVVIPRPGRTSGEHRRLVSLPSGLRLLALRYRRHDAKDQPDLPRSVPGRRREPRVEWYIPDLGRSSLTSLLRLQIDPNRTVSAGRVEIGAFRTYPEVSHETR